MFLFGSKANKKKEKLPPPSMERGRLLKLKTGTLVDIFPVEKDTASHHHDEKNSYITLLSEFTATNMATLFVNPISTVKLDPETPYNIVFKNKNGIFKDTIEISNFFTKGDIGYIEVKLVGQTLQQQRRKHARVEDTLRFDYEIIDSGVESRESSGEYNNLVDEFVSNQKKKELDAARMEKYMQIFSERMHNKSDDEELPHTADTFDIGAGGMCFYSDLKLNFDSVIGMVLHVNRKKVLLVTRIHHMEDLKPNEPEPDPSAPPAEKAPTAGEGYEAVIEYRYVYKCVFETVEKGGRGFIDRYVIDRSKDKVLGSL